MKKLLLSAALIVMIFAVSACTQGTVSSNDAELPKATATSEPVIKVTAQEILSLEEAQSLVTYAAVAANITDSTVTYQSDPIGQGDIISVSVLQYDDVNDKEKIRSEYDKMKSMRPTAETISGIGEDAYIAFPTVHIYQSGYHISITAGSGSDDAQHELLVKVAGMAVENLNRALQKS